MTNPPPLPPRPASSVTGPKTIFLIVGLIVLGMAAFLGFRIYQVVQYAKDHPRELEPGQLEFRAANKLIGRNDGRPAKGNTPRAEELAASYSGSFKLLRETFFTEGKKKPAFSLTDGEMLTFCHIAGNRVVFLIHVPELRNFTREAKESLAELSWHCANSVLKEAGFPESTELGLGLRGAVTYADILTGTLDTNDEPMSGVLIREEGLSGTDVLYPFFASTESVSEEEKTTLKE